MFACLLKPLFSFMDVPSIETSEETSPPRSPLERNLSFSPFSQIQERASLSLERRHSFSTLDQIQKRASLSLERRRSFSTLGQIQERASSSLETSFPSYSIKNPLPFKTSKCTLYLLEKQLASNESDHNEPARVFKKVKKKIRKIFFMGTFVTRSFKR